MKRSTFLGSIAAIVCAPLGVKAFEDEYPLTPEQCHEKPIELNFRSYQFLNPYLIEGNFGQFRLYFHSRQHINGFTVIRNVNLNVSKYFAVTDQYSFIPTNVIDTSPVWCLCITGESMARRDEIGDAFIVVNSAYPELK